MASVVPLHYGTTEVSYRSSSVCCLLERLVFLWLQGRSAHCQKHAPQLVKNQTTTRPSRRPVKNTLHSPVLWDKQKQHIPNLRHAFQTSFTSNIQSMHVRSVHVRFVHVRSVHVRSVPVRSVHVGSVPVRLCMSDCDQGSLPPGQSLLSVVP